MDEINNVLDNTNNEENGLMLSATAVNYLKETAKWAKFLSIIGFIGVGLMVIVGAISSVAMSQFAGAAAILPVLLYIGIGAIYFFPILYLFKFSNDLKEALERRNNPQLDLALGNLKSHYKFLGIFTIVILSIYALVFIFGILFSAMM